MALGKKYAKLDWVALGLMGPLMAAHVFCATAAGGQAAQNSAAAQPDRETYLRLAGEVTDALHRDVLSLWFPRAVDRENGGFHSHFARDWTPASGDSKFSVFQGRMTWVAAQVVLREPDLKQQFLPIVQHGADFLRNKMWDKQYGGFFWELDDAGNLGGRFDGKKNLYGAGFCIYGLAAAYRATGDVKALELAKEGFVWTDRHAHDAQHGGYFESLTRQGQPIPASFHDGQMAMTAIGPEGYKSMNTHIHLLEAFTELYRVWPDPALRQRLEELLRLVREKICVQPGVMNLFFTDAWQAIPDHDSYGHDVETGYLMIETDEVLHGKADERSERMAKMLVDHALHYGWDAKNGSLFREGTTFGKPEDTMKEWWVEVESLNALLMMHQRYGKEQSVYFERFLEQWHFIQKHTIDSQYHGLFNVTTAEGTPVATDKGVIWKAAYHDGRAFWNVSERLRQLAAGQ